MYQRFYHLDDIPFSLAPDPKYLFRTESLLEVLANLRYGIENGKGLIVVTGEVGTGKTTILRSMLQSLDSSVLAAYVFNPILSTSEFFSLLATEFHLKNHTSKADMLRALGHMLVSRSKQGLRTVLLVDEAHLLPGCLLEEIRLLSNFETNREKLLQIILCGQPELHQRLAQTEFRQLKQRISLKCSVKPLSKSETGQYIRWRLRLAGAANLTLFRPDAIEMIHELSGGTPRIINNVCDNALLTGFSESSTVITSAIIREVAEVLDLNPGADLSRQTVAEGITEQVGTLEDAINQRPGISSPGPAVVRDRNPQDNLRYIRPEIDPRLEAEIPPHIDAKSSEAKPDDYLIRSEECDAGTDSRFFSRVRVTKRSS
jgi:general secretion pathway protein A